MFVSDVVYRYDLERNMLYFSMYATRLPRAQRKRFGRQPRNRRSIAPLRDLGLRLTSGETITAAASKPADSE